MPALVKRVREAIMKSPSLRALSIGTALAVSGISQAAAQERCKISWEVPAANSTYTQQHALDVGDVAGHQVRIYELKRTFPDDTRNCEGLKLVEEWTRGYSDYTDRNGRVWGYRVITLENGDKIFAEFSGVSQTTTGAEGSRRSVATSVVTYTGGTGRYLGIRGIQRDSIVFDPEKNLNQAQSEAEYWFEK
jgi:hypothetical protein